MHELLRLAGYFAAHQIRNLRNLSDGEILFPMHGYEDADGHQGMICFVGEFDRDVLATNEQGAQRGVLLVDGYVTLEAGKFDALIVEAVEYGPDQASLTIAVPYHPPASPGGFAVHRPRFFKLSGVDRAGLSEAFFAGVDTHPEAAEVWNAHRDDSV
ncbi:hypothetical protein KZZ52_44660 [Dactylosporangium sp. AC04546]|uniref:hypothetical protein n=1 Tax=Dactylosporangium sp. AC04546 TaxID=2862460 RepID=UPI001EDCCB24|nr:hypothetical protein [Dactylosporangium sp. AC04546]WVK81008.1 hypothetical protein KZZ52_44660 [Dactylosporangium sp. AC04546]